MSTALAKRTYADALDDAQAFRALFPPACYERWEFAGSLRRRRPEVADVEHLIIPNHGDVERGDGLFTVTERVNLLWFHLDALLRGGQVRKHVYGASGHRRPRRPTTHQSTRRRPGNAEGLSPSTCPPATRSGNPRPSPCRSERKVIRMSQKDRQ